MPGAGDEMHGEPAVADPPDLTQWGLHCFCLGARRTPHTVVRADDNGRLLYAARQGVDRATLALHGLRPLDSQVTLLQAFGLLRTDGERLVSDVPMLGAAAMVRLRAQVAPVAEALAAAGAEEATRLSATLAVAGHAGHAYAVVFGHALDGLPWRLLEQEGLLPDTTLSVERPYWNGVFWAVHPPRRDVAGTNEVHREGRTRVSVWTDGTVDALEARSRSWLRGEASPSLPEIADDDQDPLQAGSLAIARRVTSALERLSTDRDLRAVTGAPQSHTLVIVAHELIWDVMEAWCASGVVPVPVAWRMTSPTPESLDALSFVRRVGQRSGSSLAS